MARGARQSGQTAAARADTRVPGLQRPCLESGRAWASATRREEARAVLAMPRQGGRSKVYRELLRQCRDGVSPADVRAVSSIAARLGILDRQVRKHLAALEADGFIVTVHHAGIRLPGQRGWTTNVFVLPALLDAVPLLPPGARAKARRLLLGERVQTALMTRGYARQLRDAIGRSQDEKPAVSSVGSPPQRLDNLSISTPMGLGSDFVSAGSSSTVSEISIVSPYPLARPQCVDNPSTVPCLPADSDGSERKPTSGSGGREREAPMIEPVWPGNDEGSPPGYRPPGGTRGLRGLKPSGVVSMLEAEGIPRSEAIQRATGFARVAAWRRARRARGEPEGRQPRLRAVGRAAAFELERLQAEKQRLGVPLESSSADP